MSLMTLLKRLYNHLEEIKEVNEDNGAVRVQIEVLREFLRLYEDRKDGGSGDFLNWEEIKKKLKSPNW